MAKKATASPHEIRDGVECKQCTVCKNWVPVNTGFYRRSDGLADGSESACKTCRKQASKKDKIDDPYAPFVDPDDGLTKRKCLKCKKIFEWTLEYFWKAHCKSKIAPGSMCLECKHISDIEYNQRSRDVKKRARPVNRLCRPSTMVKIVSDPNSEYGFCRGALITKMEMEIMLEMRHFTNGTILEVNGKHFRVDPAPSRKVSQDLVQL